MLIVVFVGGPFAGHHQSCLTSPSQLPTDVLWLVCEDGLRLLGGDEHQQVGAFTSVALYELDWETGAARYRFAGAISAKDFDDSLFDIA